MNHLYERLWRPLAGRPFTYVMREETDRHPLIVWPLVALIGSALFAGLYLLPALIGPWVVAYNAFVVFLTLLAGHLWWDTSGAHIKRVSDFVRRKR